MLRFSVSAGCVFSRGVESETLLRKILFLTTGFDIDARQADALHGCGSCVVRIPSTEIGMACQKGFASTSGCSQAAQMEVIIICVPTLLDEGHHLDLKLMEHRQEDALNMTNMSAGHRIPGIRRRGDRYGSLVVRRSRHRCQGETS